MAEVTLFKNYNGNVAAAVLVGGSVTTVPFVSGKFFTTDEDLAAVLTKCAGRGEFGIYIDAAESSIDPQFATPMDQMKKKLREEILAEMAAERLLIKDAGVSSQTGTQQSLTSSVDIVGGAGLNPTEEALKQAQIADLTKQPVVPAATQNSLDKLNALKSGQ